MDGSDSEQSYPYFSKLTIENYKSIDSLELSLDQLVALIGSNNSGKSNILKAFNIVHDVFFQAFNDIKNKGKTSSKLFFTDDDFFKGNEDNPLLIALELNSITVSVRHVLSDVLLKVGRIIPDWDRLSDDRMNTFSNFIDKQFSQPSLPINRVIFIVTSIKKQNSSLNNFQANFHLGIDRTSMFAIKELNDLMMKIPSVSVFRNKNHDVLYQKLFEDYKSIDIKSIPLQILLTEDFSEIRKTLNRIQYKTSSEKSILEGLYKIVDNLGLFRVPDFIQKLLFIQLYSIVNQMIKRNISVTRILYLVKNIFFFSNFSYFSVGKNKIELELLKKFGKDYLFINSEYNKYAAALGTVLLPRIISVSFETNIDVLIRELLINTNVTNYEEKYKILFDEICQGSNHPVPFMSISNELERYLCEFEDKIKLEFTFELPDLKTLLINSTFPQIDDGVLSKVKTKGRGIQRIFLWNLLRLIVEQSIKHRESEFGTRNYQIPIVFLIEEPELNLHPASQGAVNQIISQINTNHQVIYTTHSPHFIDINKFENLRIVQRKIPAIGQIPRTFVSRYSFDKLTTDISIIDAKDPKKYSVSGLRARTLPIMNNIIHQGFFSNLVVIVEGFSELGALWKVQKIKKKNWDTKGITIIPVMGKNNIDRPMLIFRGLNILSYFIFDGDKKNQGKSNEQQTIETNHRLLRLSGNSPEDFPQTQINRTWTVFEWDLETELKNELTDSVFYKFREIAMKELGYEQPSRVLKNLEGILNFIEITYRENCSLEFLEEIVEKITQLYKDELNID